MKALGVRLGTATPLEGPAALKINPIGFLEGRVQVPDDFDPVHEGEIERLFEGKEQSCSSTGVRYFSAPADRRRIGSGARAARRK